MFYYIIKTLLWAIFKLYNRTKLHGKSLIPKESSFILVSNHISYLDPIYIGISIPRKLHFMAKKEAFQNPLFRWILIRLGAFPVDRNRLGMKTVKTAIQILADQKVLAIFPQGTRKEELEISMIKQGASYFSLKTKAPILPVYIKGTEKVMPKGKAFIWPAKVNIYIGDLIQVNNIETLNKEEAMDTLTSRIKEEMNRLANQSS